MRSLGKKLTRAEHAASRWRVATSRRQPAQRATAAAATTTTMATAKATEPAHAGCKTAQVRARKHQSQLATAEDVAAADTAAQVAHRLKARAYRAITSGGKEGEGSYIGTSGILLGP